MRIRNPFTRLPHGALWPVAAACLLGCMAAPAATLDTVVFGDTTSESAHGLAATFSETISGNLGQPARRLLPKDVVEVNGGDITFTMAVDPARRNYFSLKLWGGDDTDDDLGRLYLYVPVNGVNYQVGYRHEGDYTPLSVAASKPPLPGRFFYSTTLLPLGMTKGKTSLTVKVVSTGRLYGLGSGGPPSGNYQFNMTMASRGIYRAYSHNEPMLDVADETQGSAPATTPRPVDSESGVLGSSGTYTTGLNNWVNGRLAAADTALTTSDVEILAKACLTPQITAAYQNGGVIAKIVSVMDGFATDYYANPVTSVTTSNYGGDGGNEVWGGRFGPLGWAVTVLAAPLAASLDQTASYGTGGTRTRRSAWGDMLAASRDNGRFNRNNRYLTNQALIADGNIYKANRGLLALGDGRALTEIQARRYLREAIGLDPWLGSDLAAGGSALKYGSAYYQVTPKGLTREWGYPGGYGEMQNYAATFYQWTGDTAFRDQAVKILKARAPFRRPAIEVVGSMNYATMERIGLLAWRGVRESDGDFANDINYGDPVSWSAGARVAGQTLDPHAVGYGKQMLADNQYLHNLVADSRYYSGLTFDSRMAVEAYADYTALKNASDSGLRLPMTDGQPDFVWSDEECGVVAVKRGTDRLWVAPFWQAKTGTGINGLARFHFSTPRYDQYGVLETVPRFRSNTFYVRPNMVDMPEMTKFTPPDNPCNAYAGQKLPLGLVPADAQDGTPFRGRVSFYAFRFGRYLFGMNADSAASWPLQMPVGLASATDLVTNTTKTAANGEVAVGPASSVVLLVPQAVDPAPLPVPPLALSAVGDSVPSVRLEWNESSGADSYTVMRSDVSGGPYTALDNGTEITSTTYTDTEVVAGNAYSYVVVSNNLNGQSVPSMEATTSAGLPAPWTAADVGTVGSAGNTCLVEGRFTLTGAGSNVGGTTDSFHFASVAATGDATLIARLSGRSLGGSTDDKIGLMARETTEAGARHFAAFIDAATINSVANRARCSYRGSTNGSTTAIDGEAVVLPEWFKLSRTGDLFEGFVSDDGANWTLVGSTTLSLTSTLRFGMFVCSRDLAAVGTCNFEGVTVPGWMVPPAAPAILEATPGDAAVGLAWSASAGAASYTVKRALVSGGPYTVLASAWTGTTYTDSGLTNGTPYFYIVAGVNAAGAGLASAEATATPQALPPEAPSGLTATAGNSFVTLSWNSSFGATGYRIKRALSAAGPFSLLAGGVTSTAFTDTSVANGTTYFYRVSAAGASGESPDSTTVQAQPSAVPATPGGLAALAGNARVSLFWPPSAGAATYSLARADASGGPYQMIATNLTTTSFHDSSLVNGTPMWYVLYAANASGESFHSAECAGTPSASVLPAPWSQQDVGTVGIAGGAAYNNAAFTVVASGADIGGTSDQFRFLSQPTSGDCTLVVRLTSLQNVNTLAKAGLMVRETLEAGSRNVFLGDTPTTANGIRFQNRSGTGGSTATSHTTSGSSSSIPRWLRLVRSGNTFTASRSSSGSRWTTMGSVTVSMASNVFVGLAVSSHDNALTTSATFSNLSLTLATPAPPVDPVATASGSQVRLDWTAASGATSYSVRRALSSDGSFTLMASGLTGLAWSDSSVTPGITYFYKVSASNVSGEGGLSEPVGAIPQVVPPGAPSSLAATAGPGQVALTWPTVAGAGRYQVKRSLVTGGPYTVVAQPFSVSYVDAGLDNGTTYRYVVAALNGAGSGPDSAEAAATPVLPVPGLPGNVLVAGGNGMAVVSWAAATQAASYIVRRSSSPSGPFVQVGTTTSLSFTDLGLSNGATVYYQIAALNGSGEGAATAAAGGLPAESASGTWASPAATAKPNVTTTASDPNLALSANPFLTGDLAQVATAFSGFTASRYYWVVSSAGLNVQLSASQGGAAITPTASATSATALRSAQKWNVGSNWTGGTVARGVDATATFPIGSPASDVAAVRVDGDTVLGRLNYSNNSSVADFTVASGSDGCLIFTVSGQVSGLVQPMIEIPFATNRRLNLGERDNAVLRLKGNQGLQIRASAGGTVTGGLGSNPSKEVAVFNVDWSAFTGGFLVERGILTPQSANRLPVQTVTLGNAFSISNNVLAGLSIAPSGASVIIDALNGNNSGRVSGGNTLTVGGANGSGEFGGIVGQQFNGIRDTTNLAKTGSGRQSIATLTGNGTLAANNGELVLTGTSDFGGAVTVGNGGSLIVNGQHAAAPPMVSLTLAGSSGSANFTSSLALRDGDQVRVTTANAGLTLATVYFVVNTPTASMSVQVAATAGGTALTASASATATVQFVNASNGTSGRYSVAAGGTLGGTGTVSPFDSTGSSSAVSLAGRLAPGDPATQGGVGTLTLDGSRCLRPLAILENGGSVVFDLDSSAHDQLRLVSAQAGDLSFSGQTVHFTDRAHGNLPSGRHVLVSSDAPGAFSGLTTDGDGRITAGLVLGTGLESYPAKSLSVVGNDIVLDLVGKSEAVITLDGLVALFDGTPKAVSATTQPAGLAVSITYNGLATVPSAAGTYAVVATIEDANYRGSAAATLHILAHLTESDLQAPAVGLDGTTVHLGLATSVLGRTYQLQRSDDLASGSWTDVGAPMPGTGAPLTLDDPSRPAGRCFYRIAIGP